MKKLIINQHEDNHPVISSSEGTVTGANEITLINWTDSGLPNDEVNNIGILIV